jgi:hypothetical protein
LKIDHLWQLSRSWWSGHGIGDYLLDIASAKFGDTLRQSTTILMLDMSGEGHPFVEDAFASIHDWHASLGETPAQIWFVSQNRAIGHAYKRRYGESAPIRLECYDWFVAAFASIFASEDSQFCEKTGFHKHEVSGQASTEKLFLCLNATPRPNRIAILSALKVDGILEETKWSLFQGDAGKFPAGSADEFLATIHRQDLQDEANRLLASPPSRLDRPEFATSNDLSFRFDPALYHSTLASIVTETEFTDGSVIRVTEKSVKALCMGHPALIFGNPHSLPLLKAWGFDLFEEFLDNEYDGIEAPAARFRAVLDSIVSLRQALRQGARSPSLIHASTFNRRHALSGGFLRAYDAHTQRPLVTSLLRALA